MKTSKICLGLLCLLSFRSVGMPQYSGASIFMKEIVINSPKYGKHVVIIDDEDYDIVSSYKWCIAVSKRSNKRYPITSRSPRIQMHKIILNVKNQVDHIDGNTLDNRKANLRESTQAENARNQRIKSTNTTGYKGVYLLKNCPRPIYWAYISFNNKRISLGCFDSKIEAAKAYNEAALKYHGEFARINSI